MLCICIQDGKIAGACLSDKIGAEGAAASEMINEILFSEGFVYPGISTLLQLHRISIAPSNTLPERVY
jgi:hypothetical protein